MTRTDKKISLIPLVAIGALVYFITRKKDEAEL